MENTVIDLSNITGCVAIIPAAGVGKRFDTKIAKQYQIINNKKILDITLDVFLKSSRIKKVLLVVSPEDEHFKKLDLINHDKIIVVDGGDERQFSVNNALTFLYDNGLPDDIPVLIHDAVRPCLTEGDLYLLLDFFDKNKQACFLAERISDSLKRVNQDVQVMQSVDRDELIHALTPQMARFIDLKKAISQVIKSGITVTDDVGALTDCDVEVFAVFANDLNPKITLKKDLELAIQILNSRESH